MMPGGSVTEAARSIDPKSTMTGALGDEEYVNASSEAVSFAVCFLHGSNVRDDQSCVDTCEGRQRFATIDCLGTVSMEAGRRRGRHEFTDAGSRASHDGVKTCKNGLHTASSEGALLVVWGLDSVVRLPSPAGTLGRLTP